MRMLVVLFTVGMVAVLTVPVLGQSGVKQAPAVDRWKQVDGSLEKAFFSVRTAAQLATRTQRESSIDLSQAILLLAQAEHKLNQAIAMVRGMKPKTAKSAPPSREQIDQLERLIGEAVKPVQEAGVQIDAALKSRPADLKKIGFSVKRANQHANAAMKLLRQITASR